MIETFHTYIPIGLPHEIRLNRCGAMRGVSLGLYPSALKRAVEERKGFPYPLKFVISINHAIYAEGLVHSLLEQGKSVGEIDEIRKLVSEVSEDAFQVPLLGAEDIARQVVIGLLLQGVIVNTVYGTYTVSSYGSTRPQKYKLRRFLASPREAIDIFRTSDFPKSPESVNGRKLKEIVRRTNAYYQPGAKHDRLSVALSNLWIAVFSRYRDQAFLSLTTLLEALFSTGSSEITHTLSERTALLLGNSAAQRVEIYEKVKKLYNTRSKIIHGRLGRKSGSGDCSSKEEFREIYELALSVVRATLNHSHLLKIIQSNNRDESISQRLTHFYLSL